MRVTVGTKKKVREDFVLLISGIEDNDCIVRRLVGSERPIYYRSRYTAPYEDFLELKNLLLLVRSMDDVNAENIVAVDLSEWIGHEQEEYLTVMLKYLHDRRSHWKYVFTVGSCGMEDAAKLYVRLKTYLCGSIEVDRTFSGADSLEEYLVKTKRMKQDAAGVFSRLFFSREAKISRGYEILESILGEMKRPGERGPVSLDALSEYLSEEDSLLCLLLGKTVDIKEESYGNC